MKEKDLNVILNEHHLFLSEGNPEPSKSAYYNAFLLSNFGIVVDKPELLNKNNLKQIQRVLELNIPRSFYENPQDTNYYTSDELLIEQLVSYFAVENFDHFEHIEIFKKDLPKYTVGDELKLREFKIVNQKEAYEALTEIFTSLCDYKHPFSLKEKEDFLLLYTEGYHKDEIEISCRDNVFPLMEIDPKFGKLIDRKDLVKYSIENLGIVKDGIENSKNSKCFEVIENVLPYVNDCPMSKKQAKYFNKIASLVGSDLEASNEKSPYRLAKIELDNGNVLNAAKIYAQNGSLFERNFKNLISKANPLEMLTLIEMLPSKNPLALKQMSETILSDNLERRTFKFYNNNKLKTHIETDYETTWRKSRINDATREYLKDAIDKKIEEGFKNFEKIGFVYVEPNFSRIALPMNNSASGKGLDVLPIGSRVNICSGKIRAFVYWDGPSDVDASLIISNDDNSKRQTVYFGNFREKIAGNAIQFSGDCRDTKGSEFFDIDLRKLEDHGYTKAMLSLNGFGSNLEKGTIKCGFQIKDDFDTKEWDPKNVEFQFSIKGDSRSAACIGFDTKNMEAIVLNTMLDSDDRVIDPSTIELFEKYFDESYLDFNIEKVASLRGYLTDDYTEADVLFSDKIKPTAEQKVVHSFDIEKLTSLVNGKRLFDLIEKCEVESEEEDPEVLEMQSRNDDINDEALDTNFDKSDYDKIVEEDENEISEDDNDSYYEQEECLDY